MAERIIESVKEDIRKAEESLKVAKELTSRLRRAGEDVSDLEREIRRLELRIERYKKAFEV